MFYTIYKTTNKINGKFYVGKHQTLKLNDNYLGSGKVLELAIKKYGKENFQKRIIFVFDTEEKMNQKEKEIVTEKFISSNFNYNCGVGGEGGAQFLNKTHSEKTRKLLSEIQFAYNRDHGTSIETRNKIAENNRKRTISIETRKKISKKAFERWNILRGGEVVISCGP